MATSLAMLLVFLPAMRAALQQQAPISSEQHHEERCEQAGEMSRAERGIQPAQPARIARAVPLAPHHRSTLRSVATPALPSQFGVRRLL